MASKSSSTNPMGRVLGDFKVFLAYLWKELGLPRPTKRQLEAADFLQDSATPWKILEAYRGFGKSWITAAFCAWKLLRNPDEKIIVLSGAGVRAYDFSMFLLRLFQTVPLLKHLEPREEQRGSVKAFDVAEAKLSQSPSVKSVGIFGQKTGSRASIVIYDDIETAENALTEEARERLLRSSNEAMSLLFPETDTMKPMIVYLGTPQTQESIYNRRSQSKGYVTRMWPAEYPDNVDDYVNKETGETMLAPKILKELQDNPKLQGQPTDSQRFGAEELLRRKTGMTLGEYKMQFMLNTAATDEERYPLKTRDLIVVEGIAEKAPTEVIYGGEVLHCFPNVGFSGDRLRKAQTIGNQWMPYEDSVLFIDPSGRGTDETAYVVLGSLAGRIFLRDAGGFLDGYGDDTLEHLADVAKLYDVTSVEIEANFGDGMFTRLITPVILKKHQCKISEVKHSVQKEKRIVDTLLPIMSRHRLIVDQQVIASDIEVLGRDYKYSLLYQLTHITRDKGSLRHDDRLDCLSMGVAHFVAASQVDEQKATEVYKDRKLDEAMERFKVNNPVRYAQLRKYIEGQRIPRTKISMPGVRNR